MTTVNKEEIQKFSRMADEWWDENGKFKPLHRFNPTRIQYIIDNCSNHFNFKKDKKTPLSGLSILDIGCGGGLISEPMCRLGGNITGIDASEKNIKIAHLHAKQNGLNIKYENKSPEQMNVNYKFDIILNLEVVEHVEDLSLYLKSCSNLLNKNGLMFTATINRSLMSYVKAIVGAEYILRWLPIGTHDWNKFLKPEELENKLSEFDLFTKNIAGLSFNPLTNKWKRTQDLSVNYIIASKKV
tara:strand:+ start:2706 stop:3431 length:726 start_codon:yes stop_codon:yes gene_type:complete